MPIINTGHGWGFNPDTGQWYFGGRPSGSPPPDFNYGNPSYYDEGRGGAADYYSNPDFEPSPLPRSSGDFSTEATGGGFEHGSNPAGYEPMPFGMFNDAYTEPPPMPLGMDQLIAPPDVVMPPDESLPPMPLGMDYVSAPPDVNMPIQELSMPYGMDEILAPPDVNMPPDESVPTMPEGMDYVSAPPDVAMPPEESVAPTSSAPPMPSGMDTIPTPPAVMIPPNEQPMPTWVKFSPPIVRAGYDLFKVGQRATDMARNWLANRQANASQDQTGGSSSIDDGPSTGWYDPAYLLSIGYEPGQGTDSLWPGAGPTSGPYDVGGYGVGGGGGSFFHDLPGARGGSLPGSFYGLGSFSAGNLSGTWGNAIGEAELRHFMQTGQIPQDAYGHNLGTQAGWNFILQHGLANPGALSGPTSIGHILGRGVPPAGEQ